MSESTDKISKRLWEALPTVPVPNLEEMKAASDFKAHWTQNGNLQGTAEQIAELYYRKGRQDGRSAATREILGKK